MQRSYNRYLFQQIGGTIDPVLSKTKISKKQSDKSYNYNNYNSYNKPNRNIICQDTQL